MMLILVVVIVLVSLAWFFWEVNHAPEGYEEGDNFHYGVKK